MNKKTKTAIAAVLAAAVISATAILFTGCGENNTSNTAAATVSTAAKPSTATTNLNNQQSTNSAKTQTAQSDQSSQNDNNSYAVNNSDYSNTNATADNDGCIDRQSAIANVKKQAGSGAEIADCRKGYTPDGLAAWIVTVIPVTNGNGSDTVTYYSGYRLCYAASNEDSDNNPTLTDDEDGYISKSEAITKVKRQAGSGAEIEDIYQGYAPDGKNAWVVTVIPITKGNGPDVVTYYANDQFCYAVE